MKTRNKGFTLIELLAVIVILAIIALIATPTILGVIEKARKGSAESSALGYIDAVEKQIAINVLDSSKTNIVDAVYETDDLNSDIYGVNVKGNKPETTSWVKIEKNQVVDYSLKIGNYIVNYNSETKTAKAVKGDTVNTKPEGGSEEIVASPTYFAFGTPTTSSTTDYTTLGKNVFVKLEGEQKSACIVRNGNLSCFKNNNWDEEQNHVQQVFSDISCRVDSSYVNCSASDFNCIVYSHGDVRCSDNGSNEDCIVNSDGSVNCG